MLHSATSLWARGFVAPGAAHARPAPPAEARRAAAVPRQRRRLRGGALAAATASEDVDEAFCLPAFVTADNKRSPCFTVLDVEVGDYPGLLRVMCWTLNGLDLTAQNAVVRTSEDGQAHNTFWLTHRDGTKLSDGEAELLADRVRDFVTYCSPNERQRERTEFCAGPIHVSNAAHDTYTVVTVREPKPTPGFLLEVASALSGMNVQINQGVVQGVTCEGEADSAAELEEQMDESPCLISEEMSGRTFRFWVCDSTDGGKLDYGQTSALVYTLSGALGYRSHPTVPPDAEMLGTGAR